MSGSSGTREILSAAFVRSEMNPLSRYARWLHAMWPAGASPVRMADAPARR